MIDTLNWTEIEAWYYILLSSTEIEAFVVKHALPISRRHVLLS